MKLFIKNLISAALLALCTMPVMAQINGTGYYRFRNAQNTSDYMSLANDRFNFSIVITAGGGAGQVTGNGLPSALDCAGKYLQNDIHLVDDADCITPAAIVYAQKRYPSNDQDYDYNLIGQGTSLLTLMSGTHPTGYSFLTINIVFQNRYTTIKKVSGSGANSLYTAQIELKGTANIIGDKSLGIRYFVDNDGTFAINQSSSEANAKWYIEPLDHFNVLPEVEFNGKYYTTLKVPFACQLSGQVEKAYVITATSAGIVEYSEIATLGGTIPAGTPVILECGSPDAAECQLIPVGEPIFTAPNTASTIGAPGADETSSYSGTNLLKGTYYCNTDGDIPYDNYNKETGAVTTQYHNGNHFTSTNSPIKYVLGITESGKLGFVKATGTAMPANKAWLETAGEFPWEVPADVLRGDVNDDNEVSIKDVSALIDYLLSNDATGINLANADMNEDEEVSIKDVSALIDYLLNSAE